MYCGHARLCVSLRPWNVDLIVGQQPYGGITTSRYLSAMKSLITLIECTLQMLRAWEVISVMVATVPATVSGEEKTAEAGAYASVEHRRK